MNAASPTSQSAGSAEVPSGQTFFERAIEHAGSDSVDVSVADRTRTRVLDAAYEQFCISGVSRASMEEVARRAGMARITIYRKFATKDALVDAVIMREFQRYFAEFVDEMSRAHTAADRLVAGFVTSLMTLGRNPLIRTLLQTEPAMLPGVVGGGDGRTAAGVRAFVEKQLVQEQQAGNISEDVPALEAADMLVRIAGSFLTSPSDLIDYDDADALADIARRFLLPMVGLKAD